MAPMNDQRDVHEEETHHVPEESRTGIRPYLSGRKERLARQLSDAAKALQESSEQLSDDRGGRLIRITAERIDRIGGYLDDHAVEEIYDDLQDYVRSRPIMMMGGAFAVGLAAARFLKASER